MSFHRDFSRRELAFGSIRWPISGAVGTGEDSVLHRVPNAIDQVRGRWRVKGIRRGYAPIRGFLTRSDAQCYCVAAYLHGRNNGP
jgi:hypothetical protein